MIGIGFLTALGPGVAIMLGALIVWAVARHHFRIEDMRVDDARHKHAPHA